MEIYPAKHTAENGEFETTIRNDRKILRMNVRNVEFWGYSFDVRFKQTIERVETTVSLPKDLFEQANQIKKDAKISDVIETALRDYVAKETRQELNRRDMEIINANAEMLNKQALETLKYQADIWENHETN